MSSNRRASSSSSCQGQMGLNTSTPSGATSVWVGTRPSKDPPQPPTTVANHSTPQQDTAEHWKTRRVSTDAGDGEYVVVSVRNSISEATPGSRRNSTVITPMSGSSSANQSFLSAGPTITRSGSDPVAPAPSLGSIPVQSRSSLSSTWEKKPSYSHGNIGKTLWSSDDLLANLSNGPGITSNIWSTNNNVLGNIGSLAGVGNSSNILASTGDGFGVANNLLTGSNNLFTNMNSLYSWGSFLPSAASTMPVMPLASSSISSLLFPQQYGLTPQLLASSLDQTSSLSKAKSLQNLTHPQTLPQTSSLLNLARPSCLPLSSLNTLSTSLALNQALLSPDLQFPLLPTFFPTSALPLTSAPGILPTQASSIPSASQNLAHMKSPPPLLSQNPSTAFLARRGSLKARRSSTDIQEFNPPLQKSPSLDQTDDQMTPEGGFSVPSTLSRSSSVSLPDSLCDGQSLGDEVHTPGVTTEPCYDLPLDPQSCMRCGKKVYAMEKQVGPVRRVLYHNACFTCSACCTTLTLKSYYLNDANKDDLNVYCASHKPLVRPNPLDSEALLLQQAVLTLPAAREELYA